MDGPLTDASPDTDEAMMGDMLLGSGKRVFAQDDVRLVAQRAEGEEASLAAAESRRDALQLATQQNSTQQAQQQLDEAQTEVEQWQDTIERRAKRFAAGRPVTMTQGYAAYLRMHGIPRVRSASLSPQVTTPQGG